MNPLRCSWCAVAALSFVIVLSSAAPEARAVDATWDGNGDGDGDNVHYGDPLNWDINAVPINNGTTYTAIIPGGRSVTFELVAPGQQVDGLSLGGNSTLSFLPGTNLAAGAATFNSTALVLQTGAVVVLPTSTYTSDRAGTIFDLNGAGTSLDMSATTTWLQSNFGGSPERLVSVTGGASMDLSGLTTITNNSGDDVLRFYATSGGTYNFAALTTIDGPVHFDIDAAAFSLDAVQSATNGLSFTRTAGSTTSLAALLSSEGGAWNVPAGGSIAAPVLTQLRNTTVNIGNGGTLDTPALVDIRGSRINLGATQTFNHAPLYNIDDASFNITGGASLAVAAGSYRSNNTGNIIQVDGAGSLLDMSSVTAWTQDNIGGTPHRTVTVSSGGTLDLSGLSSINNGSGDDQIQFVTTSGGTINLASLSTINGPVVFDLANPAFTLTSLASATDGLSFSRAANSATSLPALTDSSGGTWNVPAGGFIAAPILAQLRSTTINIGAGGTLDTPALVDIAGSTLTLAPGQTFNHGGLTNIDSARFFLAAGAAFAADATSYVSDSTGTIISIDDAGAALDLSSVATWTQNNIGGSPGRLVHVINQGSLDLSGLQTINNTGTDDQLELRVAAGGSVNLNALQTIDGPFFFNIDLPAFAVNALEQFNHGQIDVDANATFQALALTDMTSVTVTIGNGGTLDAPALANISGSTINLGPGQTLNHAGLTNIDAARFFLEGGATLAPLAAAYLSDATGTIIQVSGAGSVLDLGAVAAWTQSNLGGSPSRTVVAQSGGRIDLAALQTITNNSTDDVLYFNATSSGRIDLTSLQSVIGPVVFNVDAQAAMTFGDLTVTDNVSINVNDITSDVAFLGSLLLDANARLDVATGGGISVAEHFAFAATDETRLDLASGILRLLGNAPAANPQFVEVGGEDLGLPGDIFDPAVPGANGNFAIGQLVLGTDDQPTFASLLDVIDNGNRHSPEALYLPGLGGPDGLLLRGGSELTIDNINVYAWLNGEWVHLNTLFEPGVVRFDLAAYTDNAIDAGYIVIPEPGAGALIALGGLTLIRRRRHAG